MSAKRLDPGDARGPVAHSVKVDLARGRVRAPLDVLRYERELTFDRFKLEAWNIKDPPKNNPHFCSALSSEIQQNCANKVTLFSSCYFLIRAHGQLNSGKTKSTNYANKCSKTTDQERERQGPMAYFRR